MPKLKRGLREKLFGPCRSRHDKSGNQPPRVTRRRLSQRTSLFPGGFSKATPSKPQASASAGSGPESTTRSRSSVPQTCLKTVPPSAQNVSRSSSSYSVQSTSPLSTVLEEVPTATAAPADVQYPTTQSTSPLNLRCTNPDEPAGTTDASDNKPASSSEPALESPPVASHWETITIEVLPAPTLVTNIPNVLPSPEPLTAETSISTSHSASGVESDFSNDFPPAAATGARDSVLSTSGSSSDPHSDVSTPFTDRDLAADSSRETKPQIKPVSRKRPASSPSRLDTESARIAPEPCTSTPSTVLVERPDEGHGQPENVPEALDLEVRPKSSSSTSEAPESPTPTSKSPEEPQTDVPAITEESEPAPQSTSQLPSSTLHRPLTPEHSVSEYSVSASFLSTSPTASVTSDESLATASVQGGIPVSAPGKPASQPTTEVLDNVAAQRPVTAEGSASVISRSSSQYRNDKDPGNCVLDDRSLDTTRLPDDEQLKDEPTPVDVPAQAATTETDHPQFFASNEMRKREPELGAASPGTCAWCFDSDTYKTWKSQGGLLCIKGKPGAGKTTLMRRIIEQLQLDPQQKSCIASYSFQGATTDSQKPMSGLFHAIVHQLAQESGQPSELMSLSSLDKRSDAIGDFSETELQDVLLKHSRSRASSGRLWIFIDAVDEAGENMTRELLDYFAQLVRPSDKERGAHSTVGVCISCRRDSPLTADIPLQLRVEDSNGVDIGTYVRGELLPPPSQLTLEETERLCCYIEKKASNVFLWAFLAVEMVRGDCADLTLDQIQQRIKAMPHDLEEVYAQKIQSVSEVDRHDCLRLLQWVCFSNRPLTLPELRIALVLDPNRQEKSLQDCYDARDYVHDDELLESTMFQRSRGLLQVIPRSSLAAGDREQRVVQPVHRSVKEFLVQRGIDILCKWPVGTASRSSDLFLSRACLKYIEFPEYHETNPTSQPFATYVTFNWYLHAENAEKHGANQRDLLHLLHTRSGEMNLRTWWTNLGRATQEEPEFLDDRLGEALAEQRAEDFTIFHLAAACGLFSTIGAALVSISKVLTEDHILDDSMDESKRTLLHWAAFSGNEDMVEFFSSRKDVNTEAADKRGQTALHIAVIRGHVKIVARLLKKMPHAVNHRDEDGRAAIHYAAILGHEPILELLLAENSVDVNATDSNMQTPLSASVKAGKEGVVRLFLTRADLNMNIRGKGERSVLHSAVIQRKEAIVRLLLGRLDLDVNIRDSDKYTPLMTAVKMENVLMVRLLLGRKDVDVNAKREGNYGALLTAVSIGSDAVVGALLERPDLDMNSRGERWRTPVSIAVHMGNEAIVRLLLTRQDTDVNARDEDGSTPLLDAAYGGNVAIVQLLFGRKDTDIHGRSISGATLLSIAEQTGNKATIELVRGRLQV